MNYQVSRNLPEPAHLLDPPEAFQDDVSVEENDIEKEEREISRYLDYLDDF